MRCRPAFRPSPLMRIIVALSLSLGLSLLVSPRASAQAQPLAPKLTEGAQSRYDLSVDLVVAQGEEVGRIVQSARMRFTVASVDEATKEATVRGSFERLTVVWTEPGKQVEFLWTGAGQAPAGDAPQIAVWKALAASEIELRVSPTGEVVGVAGMDEVMEALTAGDEEVGVEALGMFAPTQASSTFAPIWRADDLVDAPRAQGAGWQTTRTVPLGAAGALRLTVDFVVTSIEGDAFEYAGDETAEALRPDDPDPASPSFEVAEHSGRIEGEWNAAAGALERRTLQRRVGAEWKLGDLTLLQAQTVNYTIIRVADDAK